MEPPDRIEVITRCAKRLPVGRDWSEIDFILDQFGLPTTDLWEGSGRPMRQEQMRYVRAMLANRSVEDTDLLALDRYLGGDPDLNPENEPWGPGSFRLFLTHIAPEKSDAVELKTALALYGVDGFVAHEDVDPGSEWLKQIQAALRSCDALVGLLHDGYQESKWCDQEVGIVIGRDRPVIPVRIDLMPYGFFGQVQAVNGSQKQWPRLAREIVDILLNEKRTKDRLLEAIVTALTEAHSYNQANRLASLLEAHAASLDPDQLLRLRNAQKTNSQVAGAFDVDRALTAIESVLEPAAPPNDFDPEEPF